MTYTFAIGDIHGCLTQMNKMIAQIEQHSGGKVIFLGDYVDRGPNSKGVIDRLMAGPTKPRWEWICLKGNHEAMMVGAYDGTSERFWWISNGGDATEASYLINRGMVTEGHLKWADDLPIFYQDNHRIFVHGGMDEDVPLGLQTEDTLLWRRVPKDYSGFYGGKHLVHGHTPSSNNPKTVGDRTNVDSACVFEGKLSCAVFDDAIPGAPIRFIEVAA